MEKSKSIYELLEVLERRIRIVRSSRIEASKRYKEDDNFYRFVTIFYSIIVTVISIRFAFGLRELSSVENRDLSIILLVMSVFTTLITMYVSIKNAGEKVGRFQSNYMELTRLLASIQASLMTYKKDAALEIEKAQKDYKVYSDRYSSLLTQSDNHDDIDYWKAVKREEDDDDKLKKADEKISNYKTWKYIKRTIALLSMPILIISIFIIEYSLVNYWK